MPKRGMHVAKLENSERLQRVDALLSDGLPHSTMEICMEAHVCAVNSIISELRRNGRHIERVQTGRVHYYQMEI